MKTIIVDGITVEVGNGTTVKESIEFAAAVQAGGKNFVRKIQRKIKRRHRIR